MIKEKYQKPKAKPVLFDLDEVYMLELISKSDGEEKPGIPGESGDGWEVDDE